MMYNWMSKRNFMSATVKKLSPFLLLFVFSILTASVHQKVSAHDITPLVPTCLKPSFPTLDTAFGDNPLNYLGQTYFGLCVGITPDTCLRRSDIVDMTNDQKKANFQEFVQKVNQLRTFVNSDAFKNAIQSESDIRSRDALQALQLTVEWALYHGGVELPTGGNPNTPPKDYMTVINGISRWFFGGQFGTDKTPSIGQRLLDVTAATGVGKSKIDKFKAGLCLESVSRTLLSNLVFNIFSKFKGQSISDDGLSDALGTTYLAAAQDMSDRTSTNISVAIPGTCAGYYHNFNDPNNLNPGFCKDGHHNHALPPGGCVTNTSSRECNPQIGESCNSCTFSDGTTHLCFFTCYVGDTADGEKDACPTPEQVGITSLFQHRNEFDICHNLVSPNDSEPDYPPYSGH